MKYLKQMAISALAVEVGKKTILMTAVSKDFEPFYLISKKKSFFIRMTIAPVAFTLLQLASFQ